MIITNDQITLEPADISQFSKAAQRALSLPESWRGPSPSSRTLKDSVESSFNQAIANAIEIWSSKVAEDIAPLALALEVTTDSGKKSQVATLIDQAKELLDVKEEKGPAVGLNPVAGKPVPK